MEIIINLTEDENNLLKEAINSKVKDFIFKTANNKMTSDYERSQSIELETVDSFINNYLQNIISIFNNYKNSNPDIKIKKLEK